MSDFLSQFSNSNTNLDKTNPLNDSPQTSEKPADTITVTAIKPDKAVSSPVSTTLVSPLTDVPIANPARIATTGEVSYAGIASVEHRVEEDPGYRRRNIQRAIIIVSAILILSIAGALIWHFSRLVDTPDFFNKPVSQAQAFSKDNDIKLEITEEFSLTTDVGLVLEQDIKAGEKISKGSTLKLLVSKGPDPDELLILPDFSKMNRTGADQWILNNRASNLRVVSEFSTTVPTGEFLRLEFRSTETTAENYHRRDYATLYYSKGAEPLEKNIIVPDFKGKTRTEVEAWAKDNSIELSVNEQDSETILAGNVISQSITAGEKIAKKDALLVVISLGRAIIVPNFSSYNASTAPGAAEGLLIEVQTRYHASVPYGRLVSQSVGAGAKLMPNDNLKVTVVYSEGLPFLQDYRGTSEGELAQTIFNNFTAKGANLTYELQYVDSYEPKGTVTSMSNYSLFIPLNYHVIFYISRGNLTPPPVEPPSSDSLSEQSTTKNVLLAHMML